LGFLRGSLILEFEAEVFEFGSLLFFGEGLDFFGRFGEVLVAAEGCQLSDTTGDGMRWGCLKKDVRFAGMPLSLSYGSESPLAVIAG
jgi:hypothetical protein